MFCDGPHTSGKDGWSAATPPSVPRNRGQLSSADAATNARTAQHNVLATRAFRGDVGAAFRRPGIDMVAAIMRRDRSRVNDSRSQHVKRCARVLPVDAAAAQVVWSVRIAEAVEALGK